MPTHMKHAVRPLLVLLAILFAGPAFAVSNWPWQRAPEATFPIQVGSEVLAVRALRQWEPADQVALQAATQRALRRPLRWSIQGGADVALPVGSPGQGVDLTAERLGVRVDTQRLLALQQDLQDPNSALWSAQARLRQRRSSQSMVLPLCVTIDTAELLRVAYTVKAQHDRAPRDAYVDLSLRAVAAEQMGQSVDVYATAAAMEAALREGSTALPIIMQQRSPKMTRAALKDLEFGEVLGAFETIYNRSAIKRDRTYNLRLAASRLDGTVLMPGEVFDFNTVVGPRDEAHGYRVAPVISQGELVDGMGGGTCQISGTLHAAALFAGLDVVERLPHSRPSYYIKMGLDATVVYPTVNYRFRNPFTYPVVLHQTVKEGIVRAEILGAKRTATVTYFRRIDEVERFEEERRITDQLPKDKEVITQRGMPGFQVYASRVIREGAHARRQRWIDNYPPTVQVVYAGGGAGTDDVEGGAKAKRKKGRVKTKLKIEEDNHPEYVVDQYLTMTQGPDVAPSKEPAATTYSQREPGLTSGKGWTERIGPEGIRPRASRAPAVLEALP